MPQKNLIAIIVKSRRKKRSSCLTNRSVSVRCVISISNLENLFVIYCRFEYIEENYKYIIISQVKVAVINLFYILIDCFLVIPYITMKIIDINLICSRFKKMHYIILKQ